MNGYVVITPVRNEAARFPRTVESMLRQTVRPIRWVIVDDGSTDGTEHLAEEAAARQDWIRVLHRKDRGHRLPGRGVMEAFHEGCALVSDLTWDFLVKLDGDLAFEPNYFERCLSHFRTEPRLGIGGGVVCTRVGNRLIPEAPDDPLFHVRGAVKMYRRECWEDIGGLIRLPGWDTVDELKANMLGWHTRTFPELQVEQLKDTGSADGRWHNWVKNGLANYVACYHPLFMLAKCIRRAANFPWLIGGVALGWGYLSGYWRRFPRGGDAAFIAYVRQQQWNHLCGRPSLWSYRLNTIGAEDEAGLSPDAEGAASSPPTHSADGPRSRA
ncbi:MAG: glycosyltransferase family A protein [Verrucomicrobiota bacterium]|nr:glycosyltransferase family 2 protein [Limisphaera sp.]MDW8380825.1 glycosyltransferase family A protein [Verrucomicrobiota bacterium]